MADASIRHDNLSPSDVHYPYFKHLCAGGKVMFRNSLVEGDNRVIDSDYLEEQGASITRFGYNNLTFISILVRDPNDGLYLGSALGFGFWSDLDSVGQDSAVVFPSVEAARKHIASWDEYRDPDSFEYVTVEHAEPGYASMRECELAGVDVTKWRDDVASAATGEGFST